MGTDRTDRPGAAGWVPDQVYWDALHDSLPACRGCELYQDATQAVPGAGNPRAAVVLLGEQPGDQEDQQGRPFVGPAGRLLAQAVEQAGLDPDPTYRTNVVKHFRWEGTRGKQRLHKNPTRAHVTACTPWLGAELSLLRPTGVVLLGATAGQAILGPSFRVGQQRGRLLDWPITVPGLGPLTEPPAWVLATTHPSAVLRSRERDEDLARLVATSGSRSTRWDSQATRRTVPDLGPRQLEPGQPGLRRGPDLVPHGPDVVRDQPAGDQRQGLRRRLRDHGVRRRPALQQVAAIRSVVPCTCLTLKRELHRCTRHPTSFANPF